MEIQLSDHFTYPRLIRFVLPSIIMMIFTSIYGIVDGLFVSNFAGKTAFAAVNLIMPFIMILGTLGFMIGTGGSAMVSKTMGEGKQELANQYFSMLLKVTMVSALILVIFGEICMKQVSILLGADENMLPYCATYGRLVLIGMPFFMMQNVFQSFLVTAEKPDLGLKVTVAAGLTNIVGDFLLVGVLKGGVIGAASATALSQFVGGFAPLFYFMSKWNTSRLKICFAKVNWDILLKTCINGSSELMTNISMSVVSILYNYQLMKYAGENGVAAYGVIMYAGFIFAAIFIGYSMGSAPIVSFHYGAGNHEELHNMLKKSLVIMAVCGVAMMLLPVLLARPLASIFVGYDEELLELTAKGFQIYCLCNLVTGFNIYGSAFFTALGNGLISALISFLRTLLFQSCAVLLLPLIFGLNGIWYAVVVAEAMALMVVIVCMITNQKKYHY